MVFPQLGYKRIVGKVDQMRWNELINEAFRYCQTITNVYEFKGLCKDVDLPSFHPYWRNEVKKYGLKIADRLEQQLKEADGSTFIFERYFSRNTSPYSVRERINELRGKSQGVQYDNSSIETQG